MRGVIHTAGVQHRVPLAELTRDGLAGELRGKVAGAVALRNVWGDGLDFLTLFSSAATVLDSPLLGGYTAANRFLDALARVEHAAGRPVTAFAWGLWEEGGMARRYAAETGRDVTEGGLGAMSPERALDAMARAHTLGRPRLAVMRVDWARWAEAHPAAAATLSLDELRDAPDRASTAPSKAEFVDAAALATDADAREDYVRRCLGGILRQRPADVDLGRPLTRIGLDSLMALELRNRVESELGAILPVVFLLQCRSGHALGERLGEALAAKEDEEEWEELTI